MRWTCASSGWKAGWAKQMTLKLILPVMPVPRACMLPRALAQQAHHLFPQSCQPCQALQHHVLALPKPHHLRQLLLGLQADRWREGASLGMLSACTGGASRGQLMLCRPGECCGAAGLQARSVWCHARALPSSCRTLRVPVKQTLVCTCYANLHHLPLPASGTAADQLSLAIWSGSSQPDRGQQVSVRPVTSTQPDICSPVGAAKGRPWLPGKG